VTSILCLPVSVRLSRRGRRWAQVTHVERQLLSGGSGEARRVDEIRAH
jgi:hypothetical protein